MERAESAELILFSIFRHAKSAYASTRLIHVWRRRSFLLPLFRPFAAPKSSVRRDRSSLINRLGAHIARARDHDEHVVGESRIRPLAASAALQLTRLVAVRCLVELAVAPLSDRLSIN